MNKTTKNITWRPQPGPQAVAIDARYCIDELFLGGGRGGGKSTYLLGDFLADIDKGEHWQGVIFRRTYPELDELIRLSHQMYAGAEYKVGRHEWRFPGGAVLKMRHIDSIHDAQHYQGHAYQWVGWDELTNWPTLEAYHLMKATLRSAHNVVGMRIRSTGNPGGPGHTAVKSYFIDNAKEYEPYTDPEGDMVRVFVPAKIYDNKVLLDSDPNYIKRLQGIADPILTEMWLEGNWDLHLGSAFKTRRQDIVEEPFDIPPDWPLFGGLDYGETNPTSFGLYTVDYDDTVYRVTEYNQGDASASTHAENIVKAIENCPFTQGRYPQAIYADPSMFVKRRLTPLNEHSPADVFADNGLLLSPASNDRIGGWRVCRDALTHKRFKTFDGWADAWWRSVPALPRCNKNPEDVDTRADDHDADAWRYAMVHIYKPYRKTTFNEKGTGIELIREVLNMSNRSGRYN